MKKKQRLLFIETIEKVCKRMDAYGYIITFNERKGRKRSYYDVSLNLPDHVSKNHIINRLRKEFKKNMNCTDIDLYLNSYKIYKEMLFIKDTYIDLNARCGWQRESFYIQD